MAYFIRSGNSFNITDERNIDLYESLPIGNYVVQKDAFGKFYLEQIENFSNPPKLYGNTLKHTHRIINTFEQRDASTGILLAGEKGSGKTLLAKNLSIVCAEKSIPCLVVNAPFFGDAFNKFIQTIDQPCMVLFDEFEKVYDADDQQHILTLMDGVFPSKKLFVMTCNDKYRIDQHMRNRPGRIFYLLEFAGLENEFIEEYCRDNLKDQQYTEKVCKIAALFYQFNFDMLKALIEEMNRYDESPQDAIKMLNAKPDFSGKQLFNFDIEVPGESIDPKDLYEKTWHGNPLAHEIEIEYDLRDPATNEDDGDYHCAKFTQQHLKVIDPKNSRFIFVNDRGAKLTLEKVKETKVSYWDY